MPDVETDNFCYHRSRMINPILRRGFLAVLLVAACGIAGIFLYLTFLPKTISYKTNSQPGIPAAPVPLVHAHSAYILAGFDSGLYRISDDGRQVSALWNEGEVRKIMPVPGGGYFLASTGFYRYSDTGVVENASEGLPTHTFKYIRDGIKTLESKIVDLKDFAVDPSSPRTVAVASSAAIYVSVDGGLLWTSLGFPVLTPGAKALAFAPYPGTKETAIWFSHPVKGVFVRKTAPGSAWMDFNKGLPALSASTIDEVSGFVADGDALNATTTFAGKFLRFDQQELGFSPVFDARENAGEEAGQDAGKNTEQKDLIIESPVPAGDRAIRFVDASGVRILVPSDNAGMTIHTDNRAEDLARLCMEAIPGASLRCISRSGSGSGSPSGDVPSLTGLWVMSGPADKPHRKKAQERDGLYLRTSLVLSPKDRTARFEMIAAKGLDTAVVDAKDDSGKLRFIAKSPSLQDPDAVSNPLDLEVFVEEAHARGIYLVARIVVFKDEYLWKKDEGRLAVRDSVTGKSWQGYRTVRKDPASAPDRKPIGENWVDPYSEEVWKYNVDIANEMVLRGFDEIQFDYIRFPTDGENLDKAVYSRADPGMDMESALLSFLSFARENIDAPISVDIYGANGWYRSGLKTGQDAELFARYVDAICPMFYPSHFEQNFLAHPPAGDRPYRIYRQGSLRNRHFVRGAAVIRPWVQSFYLDVSYDKTWYNPEYVRKEVNGIRDSAADGMIFWNNSGRYDEIPADLPSH